MKDKALNWLNLVLVADTFVVIFSFLWLVVALLGRGSGIPLGLDLWYKLWQPIFTPALGILMVGAVGGGVIRLINQQLSQADKL